MTFLVAALSQHLMASAPQSQASIPCYYVLMTMTQLGDLHLVCSELFRYGIVKNAVDRST